MVELPACLVEVVPAVDVPAERLVVAVEPVLCLLVAVLPACLVE